MEYATTTPLTEPLLKEAMKKMEDDENRASFYDEAVELFNAKPVPYPIQAFIIILAIWNIGRFSKVPNKSNTIKELRSRFEENTDAFKSIKDYTLQTADLDDKELCNNIKMIYDSFRKINGIEFTGASKIMHICNPELFVMWDSYISGNYQTKKLYGECNIPYFQYNRKNVDSYITFLKHQQARIKDVKWVNPTSPVRTLAKVIDEYNYVHITIKMQDKQKEIDKAKRAERR